jgi:hypothetical protein
VTGVLVTVVCSVVVVLGDVRGLVTDVVPGNVTGNGRVTGVRRVTGVGRVTGTYTRVV